MLREVVKPLSAMPSSLAQVYLLEIIASRPVYLKLRTPQLMVSHHRKTVAGIFVERTEREKRHESEARPRGLQFEDPRRADLYASRVSFNSVIGNDNCFKRI